MESLQKIDKFSSGPLAIFLNMAYLFMQVIRSSGSQMLFKQASFKVPQISQESTYVGVSFNKVAGLNAWNFTKKRLQHRCFPVKFDFHRKTPEEHLILKNTFLYRTPPLAASGNGKTFHPFSFFITMIQLNALCLNLS